MITKEKFDMVWKALKHAGIRDTKSIDAAPVMSKFNAGKYHGVIWFIPDATNIFAWNLYFYKVNRNHQGKLIEGFEDEKGMYSLDFEWELYKLTFKRHYLEVIENIDEALEQYLLTCDKARSLNINYEDFMVYDFEVNYGKERGLYGKYILTPLVNGNTGGILINLWIELDENGKEVMRDNTIGGDGEALYEIIKKKEELGISVAHKDLMLKYYPYFEKDPEYSKGKKIGVPVSKTTLEEFETVEELFDFLHRRIKELSRKYKYEAEFFDEFVKQEPERLALGVNV